MLRNIIQLIRVKQWIKNLFILMPVFFAQEMDDLSKVFTVLLIFLAFCFISSSIYCFNDIFDMPVDRLHPQKSKRPLASGSLNVGSAIVIAIICLGIGFFIPLVSKASSLPSIFGLFILYIVINVLYTLKLKHIAILDVNIIALGFVLRIFIGGVSTGIELSHWIIIMTFVLTLFLGLSKRKDDLNLYFDSGKVVRKNIHSYNLEFLNISLIITSTIIIVAYIMYTLSPEVIARTGNSYTYCSSIFVLLGLLKYMQLIMVDKVSSDPILVLQKSKFLQLCAAGWIITFIILIYV